MRRRNRPLVLAMFVVGCSHATAPVPVVPSDDAVRVDPRPVQEPAASATFPTPSAQIVAQVLESDEPVPMRVLEDGSVVLVDARSVHVVAPGVGIVRSIGLAHDARRRIRGVDPAGRWVATNREFVSLASGEVRSVAALATIAACARDGSRCAIVELSTPEAFSVRLERPEGGDPIDRFDLALPFGGARANELDVAHVEGAIDGDRLALLLPTFGVVAPAVYAIGTRRLVATRPPEPPSEQTIEFVGDRLLFSDRQRLSLADPNDPALANVASLRVERLMDAPFADVATARLERGWVTVDRRTLEHGEPAAEGDAIPVSGAGRTALVGDTDVTWLEGSTTRSVSFPQTSAAFVAEMTARGLYVLRDGLGLQVFSPDAREPSFTPLERLPVLYEALEVRVLERGLTIRLGERSIALGDADSPERSADAPERFDVRRDALEEAMTRLAPGHHADSPGLVALPVPGSRLGVAFVEEGRVHVLDASGAPASRPTPLPTNIRRSGCVALDFLSDVELGIHGRRPCIPTRIRFGSSGFEALGRAFVDVASTPDGSRVAVMANRRVLVLDGRTGATLADVDPHVISPRTIRIADDGSEVVLFGADVAVIDLSALPTPDATRRVVHVPSSGFGYSTGRKRLVGCEDGQLALVAALTPDATQRWPAAACRDDVASRPIAAAFGGFGDYDPRVRALVDDFVVVAATNSMLSVVRLRDGTELRIALFASRDWIEAIVTSGDRALCVLPIDASHVLSIGPDGRRAEMPRATAEAGAAITGFFGP